MKEQFVTYEIALKLKELGFMDPCAGYFTLKNEFNTFDESNFELNYNSFSDQYINNVHDEFPTAPLWQQVINWIEKSHNLFVDVNFSKLKENDDEEDIVIWEFKINEKWTIGKEWYDYSYGFKPIKFRSGYTSKHEAFEQAILESINFIKDRKTILSDVNKSKYSVDIEFDAYDRNGNEVIDDELYTNIILEGKDEKSIHHQIDKLEFGDKIIGYVEVYQL